MQCVGPAGWCVRVCVRACAGESVCVGGCGGKREKTHVSVYVRGLFLCACVCFCVGA